MADGRPGRRGSIDASLLRAQAEDFARILTRLVNGTVTRDAWVAAVIIDGANRAIVAPAHRGAMRLDDEHRHMKVETSVFGLCVNRRSGFCPIRVEYDRYKTSKQQAHVQITGESAGIGFAFAKAGQPLRPLNKLHIPVGGRRFRPTLEDFLEFLVQEGFVRNPRQGWKAAIGASRGSWEHRQVRAAVRRRPDAAVEQLVDMGYLVRAPEVTASGSS